MNAINGIIAKNCNLAFFENMGPYNFFDIITIDFSTELGKWMSAICHGAEAGFWFGLFFSMVFTLVVGIISRLKCEYKIGFRALLKTTSLLWILWILCGFYGVIIYYFFPSIMLQLNNTVYTYVVSSYIAGYVWIWGSIRGLYTFSILALIAGCIWVSADWRKHKSL